MRRLKSETRPRRDVAAFEMLAETLKLPRRFSRRMLKHIDNEKTYMD